MAADPVTCQFCGSSISSRSALTVHARTCDKNPRNGSGREARPGDVRKLTKADKSKKKGK